VNDAAYAKSTTAHPWMAPTFSMWLRLSRTNDVWRLNPVTPGGD
jgi:hypothetical protein